MFDLDGVGYTPADQIECGRFSLVPQHPGSWESDGEMRHLKELGEGLELAAENLCEVINLVCYDLWVYMVHFTDVPRAGGVDVVQQSLNIIVVPVDGGIKSRSESEVIYFITAIVSPKMGVAVR